MFSRTPSSVTPGWSVASVISPDRSSKKYVPRSVTTDVGPLPHQPRSASCSGSPEWPGLVRKCSLSTNDRVPCRMMTNTFRALIAISHAPPEPGRRTFGFA